MAQKKSSNINEPKNHYYDVTWTVSAEQIRQEMAFPGDATVNPFIVQALNLLIKYQMLNPDGFEVISYIIQKGL